jgi:hypothetical protein
MLKVYHYHSVDGLAGCFVISSQLLGGNGCWTGRVIFNRFESPASSEIVGRFKEFGEYPTEDDLLTDVHGWIRHSLFEHWTSAKMVDDSGLVSAAAEHMEA